MQKPYTKKAEKVLEIAKKASRSMHHSYIGTEHLLIGLLGEGSGAAAKVLSSAGVDEERILELIENLIAPSGNVITADAGGYSPRTLRVLENAAKEAERFKNEKVGTEHSVNCIDQRSRLCSSSSFKYLRSKSAKTLCRDLDGNGRGCQSP